jgi:hypothetical protein
MIAPGFYESGSRTTRSHQPTEVSMASYDFVKDVNLLLDAFKFSGDIFNTEASFLGCSSN